MLTLLKRTVIGFVGISIIIVGVFLLVLPGPGILTILLGLWLLSLEFDWPKKMYTSLKNRRDH